MSQYTKNTWADRVGTFLNRFAKTNESATSVDLVNAPVSISQVGTPFTIAWMNNIEDGIKDISDEIGNALSAGAITPSPSLTNQLTTLLQKGHGSTVNADKVDGADLSTDGTFAGNSNVLVPSQQAAKTYVDRFGMGLASGAVIPSNNCDSITANGVYSDGGGTAANRPTGWGGFTLIHMQQGAGYATQIATAPAIVYLQMRTRAGGSWSAWQIMWTSGSDGHNSGMDADTVDGYHLGPTIAALNSIPYHSQHIAIDTPNTAGTATNIPAMSIGEVKQIINSSNGTVYYNIPSGSLYVRNGTFSAGGNQFSLSAGQWTSIWRLA